jgi:hypothetical protein
LPAVMAAYRVGARYLWEQFAEAAALAGVPAEVALLVATEMWRAQDEYTQEMADGYSDEITAQVLSREQERSAMVQALLEGRVANTNLWEAAEILRLPSNGPYAVVAPVSPKSAATPCPALSTR